MQRVYNVCASTLSYAGGSYQGWRYVLQAERASFVKVGKHGKPKRLVSNGCDYFQGLLVPTDVEE